MNCINGHSVLDTMKFCSVCGVALAQPIEPTGQPVQNTSGIAYNPPQLPEKTKKKSNKFAVTVILLILFVAWLSNSGDSSTSDTSSSASPSEPITQPETSDQNVYETYRPLTAELQAKLTEMSDYALAEDAESLVASCFDLKDLSEQGLALPPTGNSDFDQAWGNAMESGIKSAESCIVEDFDSAATYISEMSEYITSATSFIE
jgi:hypothetical protein